MPRGSQGPAGQTAGAYVTPLTVTGFGFRLNRKFRPAVEPGTWITPARSSAEGTVLLKMTALGKRRPS